MPKGMHVFVFCYLSFFSMPGKPKGGHKGRMRRFVTEEEIADQEEKKKREQEWKASE